ncbi:MAG: metalloregulator ArsR/SmtB family transcription factor [Anaerolineales bacterium]|jgi:DNA-binding transcriptional ArsR family regulator
MAFADDHLIQRAHRQADLCQLFGNATRILILWALVGREMCVGDIASAIGSSCQNTSQHLRLMRDRGVLTSQRRGHAVYYSINGHELMPECPVLLGRGTSLEDRAHAS